MDQIRWQVHRSNQRAKHHAIMEYARGTGVLTGVMLTTHDCILKALSLTFSKKTKDISWGASCFLIRRREPHDQYVKGH